MDERIFWVAWSRLPKLGGRRLLALHDHFGSLEAAWRAPATRLAQVAAIGPGIAAEMEAFRKETRPEEAWALVDKPQWRVVTYLDDDFPAPLREIPDPPPALYVMGQLPDWGRAIAMVGTRTPTPYGKHTAHKLAAELAALGVAVISGVAAGIDRAAHEGALSVGNQLTVGVLGCGFHYVYPAANRELYREIADRGALITEYPPDVQAHKGNFPYRNRVISGLSRGVVVIEAKRKSGSLITVDHALEQGKQVFAVPGPIDSELSEGPHDLLKQGARLTAGVGDILEELGWVAEAAPRLLQPAMPLSDDPIECRLLEALAAGPRHIDALATDAGLSSAQAGSLLMMMEIRGLVRQHPGQRYERARG